MRITTLTQGFEIFIQTTRVGNLVLFFVHNRNFNTGFRAFLTPENTEALLVIIDQYLQNSTLQQPFLLFRDEQTGNSLSCFIQQNNFDFILGFSTGNITVSLNKVQTQVLKRTLMYYPIYIMMENNRRQNNVMQPQQQQRAPFQPGQFPNMMPSPQAQPFAPQAQSFAPQAPQAFTPQAPHFQNPPMAQPPSIQTAPMNQVVNPPTPQLVQTTMQPTPQPVPPQTMTVSSQINDLDSAISELESLMMQTGGGDI